VKVKTSTFGIENQAHCGFDKLHIRSYDDKGYGRLCSSKANPNFPFNGMSSLETLGGLKIKSKFFREWLLLDTDHLVIAFDSDSEKNFAGFELEYEIIGETFSTFVEPAEAVIEKTEDDSTNSASFEQENSLLAPEITDAFVAPLEEVIEKIEDHLTNYIHDITSKAPHAQRLEERLLKLMSKFDSRMQICKNGDQSGIVHTGIPTTVFDPNDLMGVKDAWLGFLRQAFENCDLWIMREADNNFNDTNWPKRIKSWFVNLARDLEQVITRK
jgi:hypothetical protein